MYPVDPNAYNGVYSRAIDDLCSLLNSIEQGVVPRGVSKSGYYPYNNQYGELARVLTGLIKAAEDNTADPRALINQRLSEVENQIFSLTTKLTALDTMLAALASNPRFVALTQLMDWISKHDQDQPANR